MFDSMVKKLKKEFGLVSEGEMEVNKDVEKGVIDQLNKSSKLDDVDTVTFGLETDDGKIVKVYVNAEQADDFEKALSEKLGEVDDIEQCLNDLSKDFEIVDVEWPDEKSEESDESDEVEDGQPETDGSEIMNKKVWDQKSKEGFKAKMESFDFTGNALTESAGNHIEGRLTTATQLLIYHAILELGIPEIALNKSPYRGSIINAIKDRATDMQKDPDVKTALKLFVQRAIDGTGGGASEKKDEKDKSEEEDDQKKDESAPEEKDAKKEDAPAEEKDAEEKEDPKKAVKEAMELAESLVTDFWEGINAVLTHIGDPDSLKKLTNSSRFKALVSRSKTAIPRTVKTDLRMKLNRLTAEISKQTGFVGLLESVKPTEVISLLTGLFDLVDPTPNKALASAVVNSPEWKAFMLAARPTLSQKFKGTATQKFRDLMAASEVATGEASKPTASTTVEPTAAVGQQVAEAAENKEWKFDTDENDNAVISYGSLSFVLDQEGLEKAIKAITGKTAIVLKDAEDQKQKITLSPRGVNLVVKKVGDSQTYPMSSTQVKDFMEFAVKAADSGDKDKEEE